IEDGNTININVDDADADPTNEFQDLQLAGNTLSLTNDATPVDLTPVITSKPITITTTDITLNNTNYTVILNSGGVFTTGVTIPLAAGNLGRIYVIRNNSVGPVNITATGGDTISLATLNTGFALWLQSDGISTWYQIN
ncbi:MAG: hypothetical protein ACR2MM_00160, partial [Flavobacteriaceae bacterium]